LRRAVEKNVTGDDRHKELLIERCDTAIQVIRNAKFKDELVCDTLRSAFQLLFELLGRMPQNRQKRKAHYSSVTDLSSYRTFSYTRTATQETNQIIDYALEVRQGESKPNFDELIQKLQRDFSRNPHKFLAWLRAEHREFYDKFI